MVLSLVLTFFSLEVEFSFDFSSYGSRTADSSSSMAFFVLILGLGTEYCE